MFKRLTLLSGDPIYVNPAHIVAAAPRYKNDEFTHTDLTPVTGFVIHVREIIEEIDDAPIGDYSPRSPLP
jgi:hypothetical protein